MNTSPRRVLVKRTFRSGTRPSTGHWALRLTAPGSAHKKSQTTQRVICSNGARLEAARLCVDLRSINMAVKRERLMLPTTEEMLF